MTESVDRQLFGHRVKRADKNVERLGPLPQDVQLVGRKVPELGLVFQKRPELFRIGAGQLLERLEEHQLFEVLRGEVIQDDVAALRSVGGAQDGGWTSGKVLEKAPLKEVVKRRLKKFG